MLSYRRCVSGIVLIRFVCQIVFDQKLSHKLSYGCVWGEGKGGGAGGYCFLVCQITEAWEKIHLAAGS